jgi:hypothetical protein
MALGRATPPPSPLVAGHHTLALGKGGIGTVATLAAVAGHHGWTVDAALSVAGTGRGRGKWWTSGMARLSTRTRCVAEGGGLLSGVADAERQHDLGEAPEQRQEPHPE